MFFERATDFDKRKMRCQSLSGSPHSAAEISRRPSFIVSHVTEETEKEIWLKYNCTIDNNNKKKEVINSTSWPIQCF